jgi:hypothetical protein
MICPECGNAEMVLKEHVSVETHGLGCGPYERFHDEWWECPACGARFTQKELEAVS